MQQGYKKSPLRRFKPKFYIYCNRQIALSYSLHHNNLRTQANSKAGYVQVD
jgi:hypothetical protein